MEKLKLIKEKVKNKIQHFIDNHKWEVVAVGVIIIIAIIIQKGNNMPGYGMKKKMPMKHGGKAMKPKKKMGHGGMMYGKKKKKK